MQSYSLTEDKKQTEAINIASEKKKKREVVENSTVITLRKTGIASVGLNNP